VKRERAKIIQYAEKKLSGGTLNQSLPRSPQQTAIIDNQKTASAMLEMVLNIQFEAIMISSLK
jgi:hypothetical protein